MVRAPRFRRAFGGIAGDTLQRAPLGWPADYPMIEHLKRKQFYVIRTLPEHVCLRASFAGTAQRLLLEALPLVRWLVAAGPEAVGAGVIAACAAGPGPRRASSEAFPPTHPF